MIFYSFVAGVNYNSQLGGNSYAYEIYGFLLILVFCVLERKSEIWLTNKLGYEGSKYDTHKGRIKLERYGSGMDTKQKKLSPVKSGGLEIIEEEKEDMRSATPEKIRLDKKFTQLPKLKSIKSVQNKNEVDADQEAMKEFDRQKKAEVKRVLTLEYKLCIYKSLRILLYVITMIVAFLAIVEKCNIWGGMLLAVTALASFKG